MYVETYITHEMRTADSVYCVTSSSDTQAVLEDQGWSTVDVPMMWKFPSVSSAGAGTASQITSLYILSIFLENNYSAVYLV